jgi:hypothetical protein
MTTYIYTGNEYNTLAEAEAAVTAFKNVLEKKPTAYCEVKELKGNNKDGWIAVTDKLTDSEILSLDTTKRYYIYSQYNGQAFHGLTAKETIAKKNEYRNAYATHLGANTLIAMSPPTNEDMSIYVVQ